MQSIQLQSSSGNAYKVKLPKPKRDLQSAYLFSFHKSGSTLMDNMVRRYCRKLGVPTFSLFNSAFASGIPTSDVMSDALVCFSKTGRIYTGFRHYPRFDMELSGAPCILLVRDPRDMLVSMYYSVAKSHVMPSKHPKFIKRRRDASSMSVDDFALKKSGEYLKSFHKYQNKLPLDTLTTYRYEDVIYTKEAWLIDLVEKLSLRQDKTLAKKIAHQFDIFPDREKQDKHIRQVHPGNYKDKLRQQTIETINDRLKDFLEHYNYL